MATRRFPFEGDDAQYISFLENIIQSELFETTRLTALPQAGIDARRGEPIRDVICTPPASENEDEDVSQELQFIQYNPEETSGRPRKNNGKERWQRELDSLLKQVPNIDNLDLRTEEAGLGDNQIVISSVIQGFIITENDPTTVDFPTSRPSVVFTLRNYALFTKKSIREARLFKLIAHFQELVFLSFCDVVLGTGEPKDEVEEIMRLYLSDSSGTYLDKLLCGSRWANRCIAALSKTDWGLRSSEVFIISRQSIHFYARYASYGNHTGPYLLNHLRKQTRNSSDGGLDERIPISIPCIIKLLVGEGLRLPDICDILGYDYTSTKDCFEQFYEDKTPNGATKRKQNTSNRPLPNKRCCGSPSQRRSKSIASNDTIPDDQFDPLFCSGKACTDLQAGEVLSQMRTGTNRTVNNDSPKTMSSASEQLPETHLNTTNGSDRTPSPDSMGLLRSGHTEGATNQLRGTESSFPRFIDNSPTINQAAVMLVDLFGEHFAEPPLHDARTREIQTLQETEQGRKELYPPEPVSPIVTETGSRSPQPVVRENITPPNAQMYFESQIPGVTDVSAFTGLYHPNASQFQTQPAYNAGVEVNEPLPEEHLPTEPGYYNCALDLVMSGDDMTWFELYFPPEL